MSAITCVILGGGRVGSALATALVHSGWPPVMLVDKNPVRLAELKKMFPKILVRSSLANRPDFHAVIIAVNDGAIQEAAQTLAESKVELMGRVVAHTSGAFPAGILASLKKKGALLASIHPVQTFSGLKSDAEIMQNSYFALEGDEKAVAVLEKLVEKIGGKSFILNSEMKPVHHLACVFVSNYLITLMNTAVTLMEPYGISREQMKSILLPLMKNTLAHMATQNLAGALTGPIARGDLNTVATHLNLLKNQDEKLFRLYCELGAQTVELARGQSPSQKATYDRIEQMFCQASG